MTLPTLVKTWQFNVNQLVIAQSTALFINRRVLRTIKNSLKGFSSNPWTVVGSSDSVTAALDGTDRWTSDANLVWANAGTAHSWLVLKQAAIATNFSICIDLADSSANGDTLTFVVSPSAGFTGGSTTARPTATDEIVTISNTTWSTTNIKNNRIHVMQSTDGQCTRVIAGSINTGGSSASYAFWLFDKPQDPVSGWSDPSVSITLGGASCLNTGNLFSSASGHGKGASTFDMYLSMEGFNSSEVSDAFRQPNDFDGSWLFSPVGLVSDTTSNVGRHGTLFDLWYGATILIEGYTFPNDGSNQFMKLGCLIFPWNGTVPMLV